MLESRPSRSRPGRLGLLLALGGLAWGGCSVEKHYEILSFFFDGVPAPPSDDPSAGEAAGTGVGVAAADLIRSAHTAYRERRCAECHGTQAVFGLQTEGFADLGESICLECHADATDLARLHGPVAAGACLFCHEPHVSRYPDLLLEGSPELCLGCHQFELQGAPPTPVHEDLSRDCLDCHFGHGGDDRYFLRPEAADR
jgi:predicted CXXCH cytochrome family protein